MMDNNFIETNNIFFSNLLKGENNEHKMVGYSEYSHLKRFNKLVNTINIDNKKILDIGSGAGGLYQFLKSKEMNFDYLGIDINPDMIDLSRQRFPEVSDKFQLCNIFNEDINFKPDIVVSIGAMNLKFENNEDLLNKFIKRLFDLTGNILAISLTSILAEKYNDLNYYFNPASVTTFIGKFCKRFILDHSYLPNDFFIILYKDSDN
jgi:SAM-dependent methyltransferase